MKRVFIIDDHYRISATITKLKSEPVNLLINNHAFAATGGANTQWKFAVIFLNWKPICELLTSMITFMIHDDNMTISSEFLLHFAVLCCS